VAARCARGPDSWPWRIRIGLAPGPVRTLYSAAPFKIDPEFKALIPPLKPDELCELELSIKAEGVRDRLVVWAEEDILLDGHHRYEIATRLKKPYDTHGLPFPSRDAAKAWLITNQFARRNLTPAERCNLVYRLKEILAPVAAARMIAGVKAPDGMRTNETVGKIAGVSKELFRQFETVIESGDEEIVQQMLTNEKSISSAYRAIKPRQIQREVAIRKDALERQPLPLASGPFSTIVADPPWDFVGPLPYPTLSVEQICSMGEQVRNRCTPDACLWLWAVNSGIPQALQVMEAWGFRYRSLLTWDKVDSGMGQPLLGQTEHAIPAVRGEPKFLQGRGEQTTLLREKKVPVHSRKPNSFFKLVEDLCLRDQAYEEPGASLRVG